MVSLKTQISQKKTKYLTKTHKKKHSLKARQGHIKHVLCANFQILTLKSGVDIDIFRNFGFMLWYGLGRPVITSEIGNWSVFVLLGWRFVFEIIIKRHGREPHIFRCHHDSGNK